MMELIYKLVWFVISIPFVILGCVSRMLEIVGQLGSDVVGTYFNTIYPDFEDENED